MADNPFDQFDEQAKATLSTFLTRKRLRLHQHLLPLL